MQREPIEFVNWADRSAYSSNFAASLVTAAHIQYRSYHFQKKDIFVKCFIPFHTNLSQELTFESRKKKMNGSLQPSIAWWNKIFETNWFCFKPAGFIPHRWICLMFLKLTHLRAKTAPQGTNLRSTLKAMMLEAWKSFRWVKLWEFSVASQTPKWQISETLG